MLKLLLRRSGTKDTKPAVTKPAAAGEIAQGELWLNNNHETPALFARADDDSLIEFNPAKGVHVGETAPTAPKQGQQWFRSSTGKLYVYYDDGAGAAQWVVANPQEAVDYSRTLSKPAVAGTAGQVLKTDGAGGTAWAAPGKILQVVNATYSTEVSSSTTTFADTGITATITPTSTSSKILVLVNQNGCRKDSANTWMYLRLLRGGTNVLDFERIAVYTNSVSVSAVGSCSLCYLDSPSTISAVTYKTQLASPNGAAVSVQASDGGTNSASTITLLEVAA